MCLLAARRWRVKPKLCRASPILFSGDHDVNFLLRLRAFFFTQLICSGYYTRSQGAFEVPAASQPPNTVVACRKARAPP